MKREELENYVGKIVCLDLVNRERPVARIIEVTDTHVKLKNPYIYVPVMVENRMQVQAVSYAAPLYDVKEITVELQHVVLRLELNPTMEQAYIQQTSGLVTEAKPSIILP